MSNFTKSVIYSTAVLAIGLVGVMAISGQRDGQGSLAGIEPAAGGSDIGVDFSKGIPQDSVQAETAAPNAEAVIDAQSEMDEAVNSVDDLPVEGTQSEDAAIEDMAAEAQSTEASAPADGIEDAASEDAAGLLPEADLSEAATGAAAKAAEVAEEIAPAAGLDFAPAPLLEEAEGEKGDLGLEE